MVKVSLVCSSAAPLRICCKGSANLNPVTVCCLGVQCHMTAVYSLLSVPTAKSNSSSLAQGLAFQLLSKAAKLMDDAYSYMYCAHIEHVK